MILNCLSLLFAKINFRSMARPRRSLWILLGGAALGILASQKAYAADEEASSLPSPTPAAIRLPWTRGGERFQRKWLLLGPIFEKAGAAPFTLNPSIRPVEGSSVADGANPPLVWTRHNAPGRTSPTFVFTPRLPLTVAAVDPSLTEIFYAYTT